MKMQIREFAKISGVSVRTLHYYDEIGLLKAAQVDPVTGYRYYDDRSFLRMQQILFYRELDFPLKSIRDILCSEDYDKDKILQDQKKMLILKKERLERLISAIDCAAKGEIVMSAFDNREFEKYKAEAKQKWGKTEAYQEHSEKTKSYSQSQWTNAAEGMDRIFAEFASCMNAGKEADSEQAQALVFELQGYITDNFYTCTKQILSGLGQMYVMDERFKQNIDRNGQGTADFASRAIAVYCRK